MSKIFDFGGIF